MWNVSVTECVSVGSVIQVRQQSSHWVRVCVCVVCQATQILSCESHPSHHYSCQQAWNHKPSCLETKLLTHNNRLCLPHTSLLHFGSPRSVTLHLFHISVCADKYIRSLCIKTIPCKCCYYQKLHLQYNDFISLSAVAFGPCFVFFHNHHIMVVTKRKFKMKRKWLNATLLLFKINNKDDFQCCVHCNISLNCNIDTPTVSVVF